MLARFMETNVEFNSMYATNAAEKNLTGEKVAHHISSTITAELETATAAARDRAFIKHGAVQ